MDLSKKERVMESIEKQRIREFPISFFLLINLHHTFFEKKTRDYMKYPMTLSQLSTLIGEKPKSPNVYYLFKYLIEKNVLILTKAKSSPFEDRKLYIVDKTLLKQEIDSWQITKKLCETYLDDCGVDVILEGE